ncbi:TetR/AcrR family transcriptional regulator [Enterococcus sp. AZ103]|uniref:TetR/AcrR family transcriptional regulator n=1 Tax=Enterococcus sp. AZ103 TaxID=2774628 RepID=UPI003F27668F
MTLETFHNLTNEKRQRIIDKGIEIFSKFSYTDATTDFITKESNISKGLLFHYFGNKKKYYLYLLNYSLELLTQFESPVESPAEGSFYEILFAYMDRKMHLILQYPNEMHFLNLASRENSTQVSGEIQHLIGNYLLTVQNNSNLVFDQAITTLNLKKNINKDILVRGLSTYVNAIINQKLTLYQTNPDIFFENSHQLKKEIKMYIDLMLQGVEVTEND